MSGFLKSKSAWIRRHTNLTLLICFVSKVHYGVSGFVKSTKGEPLSSATIRVADRRHDITSSKDGDYWRLLVPGSYEITASADGYQPQTRLVELHAFEGHTVNFILKPNQEDTTQASYGTNEDELLERVMASIALISVVINYLNFLT